MNDLAIPGPGPTIRAMTDLPPPDPPQPAKVPMPSQPRPPGGLVPLVVALLGAAFGGMIVYAVLRGDFAVEFQTITALPWGQVTLADLYLGFALYALAVLAVERSFASRLLWALPVFVLGNVWAAAWVAVRWKVIVARLWPAPPAPPNETSESRATPRP